MSIRTTPSRHEWLPSALPVFFGPEPEISDPWPSLIEVVAKFTKAFEMVRNKSMMDLAGLDNVDLGASQLSETSKQPADVAELDAPMRVVLMGRTMAGKSSLLSALTGAHHDRVGDGRQRFSRDVFGAPIRASDDIEVVDTPGVGAYDGVEDFEKAFAAAYEADLIIWVASNDSIQEETARALRLLSLIGKPIVVALNCRQTLGGVGKVNLLRFPERVFGNRDGLVDEIKRHMEASGVTPLSVVYLHALAATSALTGESFDPELHHASRIDHLVDVLLHEHKSHRQSRRVMRLIDSQRLPADETSLALAAGASTLAAMAERDRAMTTDIHIRLTRIVRSSQEAVFADIDNAVGRRRDWHLTVTDFGDSLPSAWESEIAALQIDLATSIEHHLSALAAALEEAVDDANAEWSSVPADQFRLGNLHGFDHVWGNRLLRAGIGVGGAIAGGWAGMQAGAAIGAVVGAVGGPAAIVTGIVGGVIGLGVGVALKPLKVSVDRLVLGRDGVLRKRREQLAAQLGSVLDDLSTTYSGAVMAHFDGLRVRLSEERSRAEEHSRALDRAADRWTRHGEDLQSLLRELDRETTAILLRVVGRERLARSVRRSTRLPGICILTEFEPTAFWEAWLFPPNVGERLLPGKPAMPGGAAASSLAYALGLLEAPVQLTRADSSSAFLHVDADVPTNICEAWADGLTQHIGAQISIEATGRVENR